jgi:hypothetical protein
LYGGTALDDVFGAIAEDRSRRTMGRFVSQKQKVRPWRDRDVVLIFRAAS